MSEEAELLQPTGVTVWLLGYRLMDAGRLFSTDSSSSLKKDPTVARLKTFTQV